MIFCQYNGNQSEKEQCDEYVLSSNFGHLFQTYEWGEIVRELGWGPLRYFVKKNNQISLVAQVLLRRKGPFSILYIPRGPIFYDRENFDFFCANIKKIIKDKRAIFCKINPAIKMPNEIERWYYENNFIKSGLREMHICTYQIDLANDLRKIWDNFNGNVRTAVRKAEKSRVFVESNDNEEDLKKFYKLYSNLASEIKITLYSYEFFYKIWKRLQPKGQVKIFNAIHNNQAIATEFIFLYCKKAEQIWAAKIKLDNDLGASQLIHWKIINWLKENGFFLYDLGGVPPDKNELPGIQFYKKSFGGNFVQFIGEYNLIGNSLLCYLYEKLHGSYINHKRRTFSKK